MNNINKSIYNNWVIFLTLIIMVFLSSVSLSNTQNDTNQDFSNAENAEEKRIKWGTEEFKLELIKEMSSANIALFIDEHLKSINEPSRIYYKFQKESTREDNFIGNVVLNIVKVDDDNSKHITFRYLKGRNKVRFPPQIGARGNPVFMLFFERDSRDMQRLTGGNALFFRSRIRHTIAATEIKDVDIMFDGESLPAKEISFQPFTETELKNRVSRYKTKKFVIVMSEKIPGYIFKIETFIKDLEDPDDRVKETLEFQGIRTNKELRQEYKQRKEKG
ncbi:MAG: hypothetical protein CBC25_07460 [Pelagibacteraceae bacterium TMED65]|nr:hypothetical protein [Rickettsiales bacterium]OUU50766.1 MAG: hypothetical protein CBC25_07460 [Pelagibacteraceae bacterium TMED65]|tara:strand:- start:1667 stop:2494 length:828 start_codon:yes stop_codon:yes gene_type:complete